MNVDFLLKMAKISVQAWQEVDLMIHNYHNYMTYFLACSCKMLQIDILNLFTYICYLHLFSSF